ncbi:MAG TPA: metal ABC transporter ATP-binding protein [Abditibacteriaceae bacterium]|jgi:ABC-type Mn2+/Zn2+ transport system ATPase subunit
MTQTHTPRELIRFENVDLGYGRRHILGDLNFSVSTGDFLAIVGSNGSGKTTLLRGLLGNVKPRKGHIEREDLHCGYVPQLQTVDEVFPLTIFDVVLMGRYGRIGALKRPAQSDRDRAHDALKEVGIDHLSSRLFRELSGGQKQRALIARALASDPDLLVLDEHTNDLDIATEKSIMALIDRLHKERHLAVVMVSHSINHVANHARSVGIIKDQRCSFEPVATVLDEAYLEKLYGIPLRVVEVDGQRIIL